MAGGGDHDGLFDLLSAGLIGEELAAAGAGPVGLGAVLFAGGGNLVGLGQSMGVVKTRDGAGLDVAFVVLADAGLNAFFGLGSGLGDGPLAPVMAGGGDHNRRFNLLGAGLVGKELAAAGAGPVGLGAVLFTGGGDFVGLDQSMGVAQLLDGPRLNVGRIVQAGAGLNALLGLRGRFGDDPVAPVVADRLGGHGLTADLGIADSAVANKIIGTAGLAGGVHHILLYGLAGDMAGSGDHDGLAAEDFTAARAAHDALVAAVSSAGRVHDALLGGLASGMAERVDVDGLAADLLAALRAVDSGVIGTGDGAGRVDVVLTDRFARGVGVTDDGQGSLVQRNAVQVRIVIEIGIDQVVAGRSARNVDHVAVGVRRVGGDDDIRPGIYAVHGAVEGEGSTDAAALVIERDSHGGGLSRRGDIVGRGLNVGLLGLDVGLLGFNIARRTGCHNQHAVLRDEHCDARVDVLAVVIHQTAGHIQAVSTLRQRIGGIGGDLNVSDGNAIGQVLLLHVGTVEIVVKGISGSRVDVGGMQGHDGGVGGLKRGAGIGVDGGAGLQQDGRAVRVGQAPADKAGSTVGARIAGRGNGAVADHVAPGVANLHGGVRVDLREAYMEHIGATLGRQQFVIEDGRAAVIAQDEGVGIDAHGSTAVLVCNQGQRGVFVIITRVDPGLRNIPALGRRDGQPAVHQLADLTACLDGIAELRVVAAVHSQALAVGCACGNGEERDHHGQNHDKTQQSFSFQFHRNHLGIKIGLFTDVFSSRPERRLQGIRRDLSRRAGPACPLPHNGRRTSRRHRSRG